MITKWDFWRDYPEAHDTSIEDGTETLAAKYFEYAKPANIDKTLFYDVYKFNGSAKADKDKNGNLTKNVYSSCLAKGNRMHVIQMKEADKDSCDASFGNGDCPFDN